MQLNYNKLRHVHSLISKERLDQLRSHHTHATHTTSIAEPCCSRETDAEIRVTSIQSDTCTENAVRASLSFVVRPRQSPMVSLPHPSCQR